MLFPFTVLTSPLIFLVIVLLQFRKVMFISITLKIILGTIFLFLGIATTFLAMKISINELLEKGVYCMTGVGVFIPIGLVVNFIGIPIILFSLKNNKTVSR